MLNSETTISDCLESIELGKSWSNSVEVIVVDNNSTDKSADIVLNHCKKYNNIRLMKQPKQGVSAARNLGLKKARGDFIYFMDSDDTTNREVLESVILLAKSKSLDCVICNYSSYDQDRNLKTMSDISLPYDHIITDNYIRQQLFASVFTSKAIGISNLWNKLYKYSVISKYSLAFDENQIYGEDLLFNLQFLDRCKKIVASSKVRLLFSVLYNSYISGLSS